MTYTKAVSTKRDRDDVAIRTNLTVDLSLLTPADKDEIIVSASVIKWQASIRKGEIPTEATYVVPRPGTKATASIETIWARMSTEERKAFLAKAS